MADYFYEPLDEEVVVDHISYSNIVRAIRCSKKISAERLAPKVGWSANGIKGWERGLFFPKLNAFLDILDYGGYEMVIRRKTDE